MSIRQSLGNESDDLSATLEGWSAAALEDLTIWALGGDWGVSPDDTSKDLVDVRVLRGTEFRNWDKEKGSSAASRRVTSSSLHRRQLTPGDLVIEISGGGPGQPVGRSLLVDAESLALSTAPLVCSNFCRQVRLHAEIDPAYLQHNLRYQYALGIFDRFQNQTVNLRNLQFGQFMRELQIPIPPLAEQKRIVVKIDELLSAQRLARERLNRVSIIMKHFRQAVLSAACSGRLTEGWREDPSVDGALPPNWTWAPVSELAPKDGIFDGPFGSNLKTSDYTDQGVRVIRLENIGHNRFLDNKRVYISNAKYLSLVRHSVYAGDIMFASFIEEQIHACVLPKLEKKAIAKADCFCIRPNQEKVINKYLVLQLVCSESHNSLLEHIHGDTRPRINTTQLKTLNVRVCPLPEQQEIVRRVDELFSLADTIERRIEIARLRAEKLTQSILAKAFRGELVPTEAELARLEGRTYEPADVLLERTKNERQRGQNEQLRTIGSGSKA